MILVVQRVSAATVRADAEVAEVGEAGEAARIPVAAIGRGVCVLGCVLAGDGPADAAVLADKLAGLRIFEDEHGRTNLDLAAVGAAVLVVPQFTLAADCRHGRRPSFSGAAAPDQARALLAQFVERLAAAGLPVSEGRFGAAMSVEIHNEGPFTLILDSSALKPELVPDPLT